MEQVRRRGAVARRNSGATPPERTARAPGPSSPPPALARPAPGQGANPFDRPREGFVEEIDRRSTNHKAFMEWVRSNLAEKRDFAVFEESSKPTMLKPGAEKVIAALGLRAHFPSLPEYERAAMGGSRISNVVIGCQLLDAQGGVVAEGAGARSVAQDMDSGQPNLNTTIKMAAKSAYIDAALRAGGLSEVFTQDLDEILGARNKRGQHKRPDHFGELKTMVREGATSWQIIGKLLDEIEPGARGQARRARPESLKRVLEKLREPKAQDAQAPAQRGKDTSSQAAGSARPATPARTGKPSGGEPKGVMLIKRSIEMAETTAQINNFMRSVNKDDKYSKDQLAEIAAVANRRSKELRDADGEQAPDEQGAELTPT